MKPFLFLALSTGCASLPIQSRLVGGEAYRLAGSPRFATAAEAGHCSASLRVHVVNTAGEPIPGAAVISSQRVTERADKAVLSQTLYQAGPVMTDSSGNAQICDPETLTPPPSGIAAGFVDREGNVIQVFRDSTKIDVNPPYNGSVTAVLPLRM